MDEPHQDVATDGEPIIRVRGLHKKYGSKEVLRGIDLDVWPGRILGYIGPNGAGKTTTVKVLMGMLGNFAGEVRVCGYEVARQPVEVKQRVGYVPETAALYETLTPSEYMRFVGSLHGLAAAEVDHRAGRMLALLGLEGEIHRRMSTFSKGMKQKVLIASSLIHNPDVIIMDEPLSGLDANSAILVKEILSRLAQRGRAIFYCSHVMDVVERICDRIVILSGGTLIADGSFEQLRSMSKAPSLEQLFSELTSEGTHESVAEQFIEAFDNGQVANG
jgi:ABC-2 type transport system ATP-binding protein